MAEPWITLIGVDDCGFDKNEAGIRSILGNAEFVMGGARQLAMIPATWLPDTCEIRQWPSPLGAILDEITKMRRRRLVVLATGDPMWFGIGSTLSRRFGPDDMTILPAHSAFSLAAARLAWPLADVVPLTLHGRPLETLVPDLYPGARLLILAHDSTTPDHVARILVERGLGASEIIALAHMGSADEQRFDGCAESWSATVPDFHTLAVRVADEPSAQWQSRLAGLDDSCFEHDGKLTKREVRATALAKLSPHPGALLWDIGCGCGSVAIEWLRAGTRMRAIGLEPDATRREMAMRNARNLGVPHLVLHDTAAPEGLNTLPSPDAVFVGGGLSRETIDEAMAALRPGGRLVAHAVTLESEQVLLGIHEQQNGELIRLSVVRAEPVGRYRGWRPAMPVSQWSWVKS